MTDHKQVFRLAKYASLARAIYTIPLLIFIIIFSRETGSTYLGLGYNLIFNIITLFVTALVIWGYVTFARDNKEKYLVFLVLFTLLLTAVDSLLGALPDTVVIPEIVSQTWEILAGIVGIMLGIRLVQLVNLKTILKPIGILSILSATLFLYLAYGEAFMGSANFLLIISFPLAFIIETVIFVIEYRFFSTLEKESK